ncbi:hypothetical protein C8Q75DRAFT_811936 [Abortiporus biennis]|nr:hypothetical protein C8Q75DRAFT_811936 [Abortiporus biennis]
MVAINDNSANSLPNEILLHIFSFQQSLSALIATQGVCRRWRSLVPIAHTHPVRLRLLEVYQKATLSPAFAHIRPYITSLVKDFPREEYAALLPESTPDEFLFWIREWPSKAIIDWLWPGLPFRPPTHSPTSLLLGKRGYNSLANGPRVYEACLINPDGDLTSVDWADLPRPLMWPATHRWEMLGVVQLRVTLLEISQLDQLFGLINDPLRMIIGVDGPGKDLVGTLWHFDLGDYGLVAESWIEFLEEEIRRQDLDLSGDRYDVGWLFAADQT